MKPILVLSDAVLFGDDCTAIALLHGAGQPPVEAIVAISGNAWAEEVYQTLCRLLLQLGMTRTPVFTFPSAAHRARLAQYKQFKGLEGTVYYAGALDHDPPCAEAAEYSDLFDVICALNKPDILVLGPVTALSNLLCRGINLKEHIGAVYILGGALNCPGNASPYAEFNFWFDPYSANVLMSSDLCVILLTLDTIIGLRYPLYIYDVLSNDYSPAAYLATCLKNYADRPDKYFIGDEVLAAILISPSIIRKSIEIPLAVEIDAPKRYGALRAIQDSSDRRPIKVITELDTDLLWDVFSVSFSKNRRVIST